MLTFTDQYTKSVANMCYRLIDAQISAARRPAASVVLIRAGHDRR
jgi:hypothetical protein